MARMIAGTAVPKLAADDPQYRVVVCGGARRSSVRTADVHEAEHARKARVTLSQVVESETGIANEVVDLPMEMAAASERAPHRVEPTLPGRDSIVRSAAVLREQQPSRRLQHPSNLRQRLRGVGDAAERPRH